ncbi:pirin family protein [bacterium]|nr:pirin family protein [bacterium]
MDPIVRPSDQRGHADHGWLRTWHSFSFADYQDPAHMGFRRLRVINEDRIGGGGGFGRHPHRDMEIVTYMIAGALEHHDSLGHGEVLRAGEVQRMSAGTGIEHSEMNASPDEEAHLLQIWIHPERLGLEPGYEQRAFTSAGKTNRLRPIVTPDGRDGSLRIHQDATLYATVLKTGESLRYVLAAGRHAWIQVIRGRLELNGASLGAGDGAALAGPGDLELHARTTAEFLTFDLA